MSVRRRTLLTITAATGVGAAALGAERMLDRSPTGTPTRVQGAADGRAPRAPDEPFAVGVREFSWLREGRPLLTRIWYPAIGTPGSDPVTEALIADGRFPVVAFSHGMRTTPESYLSLILPLAAAGFVVTAPDFPDNTADAVTDGTRPKDLSEVVSLTLALNAAPGDPFNGHLDDRNGIGAAGHSLGGMTTHALLTDWRDERIAAAALLAAFEVGDPAGAPVNVLFVHGAADPTADYAVARRMYEETAWPKAFLTHLDQGHDEYVYEDGATYPQTRDALVDWMRWSLYADPTARDRLRADATSDGTAWESALD
ncbi:alpha/beta hydrolase [Streptomyces sp. B6B3]|uniref:alpha/beta hydrolase family protein n=1 Tax=Streptomyces sp. B6B3 TaxID=3153570 RepID=UPI00325DC26E